MLWVGSLRPAAHLAGLALSHLHQDHKVPPTL